MNKKEKKLLQQLSLPRRTLLVDHVGEYSPTYDAGKLTIYAGGSKTVNVKKSKKKTGGWVTLSMFNAKANSVKKQSEVENELFVKMLKKVIANKKKCTFIGKNSDFSRIAGRAFSHIEQHDLVVYSVITNPKSVKFIPKEFFDKNKKKDALKTGGFWTADVYASKLIPEGHFYLMATPDCVGVLAENCEEKIGMGIINPDYVSLMRIS